LDKFKDAVPQENGSGKNAHHHSQNGLQAIVKDNGMEIQRDEEVTEEHVHNTPTSVDAGKDVTHNVRTVTQAFTNKAADEKQ
jgi:hypothetical protein